MTKTMLLTIVFLIGINNFFSQVINSDTLFVNDAVFYINDSYINETGVFINNGETTIEFDFTNKNLVFGGNINSEIKLAGNWFNHGTFQTNLMSVNLIGAEQIIGGPNTSSFYNLILSEIGLKQLKINTITHLLDLTDNELATNQYNLTINNTDVDAINYNLGFVSSKDTGRLIRYTNQNDDYIFPVGSSEGYFRYRPVIIKPNNNLLNHYAVRFVNESASNDGFVLNQKNESLEELNNQYYYHLYRKGTTKASITFKYNEIEDQKWEGISQWQNSIWQNTQTKTNQNYNEITQSISNFNSKNFVMANTKSSLYIPTAFTPNEDGINDLFQLQLSDEFYNIEFNVYNRWGQNIFFSNEQKIIWDGKFKDELVQSGVYVWKIKYKLQNEIDYKIKTGNITIIK